MMGMQSCPLRALTFDFATAAVVACNLTFSPSGGNCYATHSLEKWRRFAAKNGAEIWVAIP